MPPTLDMGTAQFTASYKQAHSYQTWYADGVLGNNSCYPYTVVILQESVANRGSVDIRNEC